MPKTSINPLRHVLRGQAMGTHWQVTLDSDLAPAALSALQAQLQEAVRQVDTQMSTWRADSDLMRLNAAPCDVWLPQPPQLMAVLHAGLTLSAQTGGAFEMNLGDAVRAWGFGPAPLDVAAIKAASSAPRIPASAVLHLDMAAGAARKSGHTALDLSGIAKGFGVDCLAKVLMHHGICHALCAIDGELRAVGTQAGQAREGQPWPVSIELPSSAARTAHSVLALDNGAVATSGDYRHFVTVKGVRLSHSIDPKRGAPCVGAPASVTVLAPHCMQADAMATALLVMGAARGANYARANGISALFLNRAGPNFTTTATGHFAQT